jgi:predicted MFS family arabinose efflux permease
LFEALRNPRVGGLLLLFFLSSFTLAQVEAPLFLFMQGKYKWSFSEASYGFAYIGVMMVITQGYLIRKLLPKFKEFNLAPVGFVSMAIGLVLVSLGPQLAVLAVGVTFLALGNGLANPSLTGTISLASDSDEQGHNLGVSQSMSALARILGPALGGWVFEHVSMGFPFLISAAVALAGGALTLVMRRQMRSLRS